MEGGTSSLFVISAQAAADAQEVSRASWRVWIEIYGTGIGLPIDRINAIFGALHQLDPQREELGLGLWIARSATEVLGHELSVRSTVDRGSRLRLVVPLGMARKP